MPARAYPPQWRALCALLLTASRAGMLILLVLLLFFETHLTNPLRLIRVFTLFCLVPELAAWFIGRAFEVTVRVDAEALVIEQPSRLIEIPLDSIERIERWALPLPGDGFWIRLESGSRFDYGLQTPDPEYFVDALSAVRENDPRSSVSRFDIVRIVFGGSARSWYYRVLEFPVFALVPALPLFRLHQWITYGGTFGEYYQYGLGAYVLAFLIYWANATIWLVLYAAGLRAIVAMGVLAFACVVPSRAAMARRAGDLVHRLLYVGGVAAFLVRLYILSRV